ncbi:prepilin-type N-terminal cleavage/methylation domain-containing protein [Sulfurimonas sp.]|uniref:type IV pilus modification PilV family protein n=1 Tax=Sulfurimonas sp. TaxID=2022749 RepID=UPI0019F996AC|nr:prepilin-type N-terminal cleavage/methylation domain-containing protein [Sulfurimonas sp.]MBE0513717.1 prepilin-type N-terminal cleavage/methylation domain-containing protein [Sulfurimonas sp.]
MKQSASVWDMHKKNPRAQRGGFTLLEVMIAVMILSVVIMALLQMYANGAHIFKSVNMKSQTNQYISFLVANKKYGFKNDTFSLDKLVDEFEIEDELRRELRDIKVELLFDGIKNSVSSSSTEFEMGRVVLKSSNPSGDVAKTSFLRLRAE